MGIKFSNNYPYVEEVIISQVPRGEGTADDPCRTVMQVHRKDGTFIAEADPYMPLALGQHQSDSASHGQEGK